MFIDVFIDIFIQTMVKMVPLIVPIFGVWLIIKIVADLLFKD